MNNNKTIYRKELAKELGYTERTLYSLIKEGEKHGEFLIGSGKLTSEEVQAIKAFIGQRKRLRK